MNTSDQADVALAAKSMRDAAAAIQLAIEALERNPIDDVVRAEADKPEGLGL